MDMIDAVAARLEASRDLPAILDAACSAFEVMLPVIHEQQDPASGAFTTFVMAAAYAANGRDALLFAPCMLTTSSGPPDGDHQHLPARETALRLTGLSRLIRARLADAAELAADEADRRACRNAQREAGRLVALLAGVAGP
jgi:hypothetical protein